MDPKLMVNRGVATAAQHPSPSPAEGAMTRQCPLCAEIVIGPFAPGPGGRPDASCPRCGSLERHRFLAFLLDGLLPVVVGARLILDVAPSAHTSRLLDRLGADRVVRMDFDPAADRRAVNVRASLTEIPLPNASVDLMICFHVLEHVPDDRAAMREIARVLSGGGLALLQVPWRQGLLTDEDPTADASERARRFGQADHVRYYGGDFDERLADCGLDVLRVTPSSLLDEAQCRHFHLAPGDTVWAVRTSDATGRVRDIRDIVQGSAILRSTDLTSAEAAEEGRALRTELERLERSRAAAYRDAKRWETAYRKLRAKPAVRVLAGVNRIRLWLVRLLSEH
jgi:SAM-dependent methyltransferase